MTEDLPTLMQRLATSTGASSSDIADAVDALKSGNALFAPWSEETIVQALPTIVEMAVRWGSSVRKMAGDVRATTVQVSPDEEHTA